MKNTIKEKREGIQRRKAILEEMAPSPIQGYQVNGNCEVPCDVVGDLCLVWLHIRHGTVKKSTYSAYDYCVKVHILPFFETIPLLELDENSIYAFIEKIQKKGLADSTIHFVLNVFRFILKFGVKNKLIDKELLAYCVASGHRTESRILTIQESNHMKEYLLRRNNIFSIAILLCRATGIRVGELCGLKWGDMNFQSNTFRICRTVSRIPNPDTSEGQPRTILYIRPPKSCTSSREIPIPDYLIPSLKSMKREENQYLLTGREICTEPRNVQKKFKTILKHCEMQDCNFHAMRHGFATACLEKGIDCKTVSSILGHASTRTTMEIYVHTTMRQKQNCINSID